MKRSRIRVQNLDTPKANQKQQGNCPTADPDCDLWSLGLTLQEIAMMKLLRANPTRFMLPVEAIRHHIRRFGFEMNAEQTVEVLRSLDQKNLVCHNQHGWKAVKGTPVTAEARWESIKKELADHTPQQRAKVAEVFESMAQTIRNMDGEGPHGPASSNETMSHQLLPDSGALPSGKPLPIQPIVFLNEILRRHLDAVPEHRKKAVRKLPRGPLNGYLKVKHLEFRMRLWEAIADCNGISVRDFYEMALFNAELDGLCDLGCLGQRDELQALGRKTRRNIGRALESARKAASYKGGYPSSLQ